MGRRDIWRAQLRIWRRVCGLLHWWCHNGVHWSGLLGDRRLLHWRWWRLLLIEHAWLLVHLTESVHMIDLIHLLHLVHLVELIHLVHLTDLVELVHLVQLMERRVVVHATLNRCRRRCRRDMLLVAATRIGVVVYARVTGQLVGSAEALRATWKLAGVRLFARVRSNVSRLMLESMKGLIA